MSRMTGQSGVGAISRPSAIYTKRLSGDPYGRWSLAAICAVMLCQVAFLVFGCDWDLCNDEAEYWAWSRQLDWSYWSRGPLIAWLIRLATELLGGMSVKLTGSLMLAVRLPAVLLGGLTAWGVFRLASLTTGHRRPAMMAVLLLPAIPVLAIGGVLITSDTPLVCCWTWAAVWTYRAVRSQQTRAWIAAGLIGAVGVWAKYSFLAFLASVGLFLLVQPGVSTPARPAWLLGDVALMRRVRAGPDSDLECNPRLGGGRPVGRPGGPVIARDLGKHLARAHLSRRRLRRTGRSLVGRGNGRRRRRA